MIAYAGALRAELSPVLRAEGGGDLPKRLERASGIAPERRRPVRRTDRHYTGPASA